MYNADIMTDVKGETSSLNPGAAALLERLRREGPLVSDGATGTFLQQHGLEPGGCPEEFNASRPEVVKEMARAYFEAGSDLVLTNSFGGSVFMQKKYGYEGRVFEFNKLAAQHARSQAPDRCYVMGSVGPTGEFLEPLGPVSENEMYEAFVQQIEALAEGRRRRRGRGDHDRHRGSDAGHSRRPGEHGPDSDSYHGLSTRVPEASSP